MTYKRWTAIILLPVLVLAGLLLAAHPFARSSAQGLSAGTVAESNDFATRVLGDPWDMSEYTDLSQWLNHDGADITNIGVSDGIFSAQTTTNLGYVYPLFPGYQPGFIFGKTGANHPIASATYREIYIAMHSASSGTYNIQWAQDRVISSWGDNRVPNIALNGNIWKLYHVDLADPYNGAIGQLWPSQAEWQMLKIFVNVNPGTQFQYDWIRLTDGVAVNYTIDDISGGGPTYDLYAYTDASRMILVKENFSVSGGSYTWDTQGMAAGVYTLKVVDYGAGSGGTARKTDTLTVNQAPVATFARPAMTSGTDYASSFGNPWDMKDAAVGTGSDITEVRCIYPAEGIGNYYFQDGLFSFWTPMPSAYPAKYSDCIGGGANEVDAKMYLNMPGAASPAAYRYLSMRLSQNGPWSKPAEGMIVRWMWAVNRPGLDPCTYVSKEIALDIGWNTYEVDLYHPDNRTPVESFPSGCGTTPWDQQTGSIAWFRLDPNENINSTGITFVQEFDWIRLTSVEGVNRGTPLPVVFSLNKNPAAITSVAVWYTSDRQQPGTQAAEWVAGTPTPAPFSVYLPMVMKNFVSSDLPALENEYTFLWDTSGVSAGSYYICAVVGDGVNNNIRYCSDALIRID